MEDEIKKRIKNDDPSALELIYDQFAKKIYVYLLTMFGSEEKVKDVMQEVFIRIAEKRRKLLKVKDMESYIFILARNQAMEYLRHQPKPMVNIDQYENILSNHNSPPLFTGEEIKEIEQALISLPLEQKEVITLKVFEDLSFSEIGKRLGISRNTVWARYRYGMEKLRNKLREFKEWNTER